MFKHVISTQAKIRPDALAMLGASGTVTFREFDEDIDHLRELLQMADGLSGLVAISITSLRDHWVALFALARLGLQTISLSSPEVSPIETQIGGLGVSWIITDSPLPLTSVPIVELKGDWRSTPAPQQAPPPRYLNPGKSDFPARLIPSSGSTGKPKLVSLSSEILDQRIKNATLLGPLAGARLLSLIGIDNWGGFFAPLLSWATAGSVIFPPKNVRWPELLSTLRPELMILAPMQLAHIVQSLPRTFFPYGLLRIVVAGGAIPPGLSHVTRTLLSPELFISYASTECGFSSYGHVGLASDHAGAAGYVLPWCEVEIVDDAGVPVPAGAMGTVRTRGEESVREYHNDAEASGDFKDGWFYPGDVGALSAKGLLTIHGRATDVMNIGGVKLAPLPIEDALLKCPGVRDVAVVAIPQAKSFDIPYAAIVIGEGFEAAAAAAALKPLRHEIRLVIVDSIPRTPGMAKIKRGELRDQIVALVSSAVARTN